MPLVNTAQTLGPAASTRCSPSMFAPSRSAFPFRVFQGEEERPLPDPSAPACVPGAAASPGAAAPTPGPPRLLLQTPHHPGSSHLSGGRILPGLSLPLWIFSASLSGVSLPPSPQALSPTAPCGSSEGRAPRPRAGEGAVGIAVPDPAAKPAADEPPAPPGLVPSTAGGVSALGTPVPCSPRAPLSVHVPPLPGEAGPPRSPPRRLPPCPVFAGVWLRFLCCYWC